MLNYTSSRRFYRYESCYIAILASMLIFFILNSPISSFAQTERINPQIEGLNFQVVKVPYELIHRVFAPGTELESISFKEWNQFVYDSEKIKYRQDYPNEIIERVAHRLVNDSGRLSIETAIHTRTNYLTNRPRVLLPDTIIPEKMESNVFKDISFHKLGVSSNGLVGIVPGSDVAGIKRTINPVMGSTSDSTYYTLDLSSKYVTSTTLETNKMETPVSSNGLWNKDNRLESTDVAVWTFSGNLPPVDLWINKSDETNQDARPKLTYKTQAEWTLTAEALTGVLRFTVWGPPDRFDCQFRIPDECFITEYQIDGVEDSSQALAMTKTIKMNHSLSTKHEIVLNVKMSYPVFGVNHIPVILLENSRFIGSESIFKNKTSAIVSGFRDNSPRSLLTLPEIIDENQKIGHNFRFFKNNESTVQYDYKIDSKGLVWSGSVDYVINEFSDECYLRFRIPDSVSVDRLKMYLKTDLKLSYAMVRSIKQGSADVMSFADVVIKDHNIEIRIPPDKTIYDRRFLDIKLDLQRNQQADQFMTPEVVLDDGDRLQNRWRVLSRLSGMQATPLASVAQDWLRNDQIFDQALENRMITDKSYKIIASWNDYPRSLSSKWNVYRKKIGHEPKLLWLNLIHDHFDQSITAIKVAQELGSNSKSGLDSQKKTTSGLNGMDNNAGFLEQMDINDYGRSVLNTKSDTYTKFSLNTQQKEFLLFIQSIPQTTPIILVSNESRINSILNGSDDLGETGLARKIGLKAIESLRKNVVLAPYYHQEYAEFIRHEKISDPKTLEQLLHINTTSRQVMSGVTSVPVVNQNVDILIDENGHVQYRFHSTLFPLTGGQDIVFSVPSGLIIQSVVINDSPVNAEDIGNGKYKLKIGSFQNQINIDIAYGIDGETDDLFLKKEEISLALPEMNTICTSTTWKVIDLMGRDWELQVNEDHKRGDSIGRFQKVAKNQFLLFSRDASDVNSPKIIAVSSRSIMTYDSGMALLAGVAIALVFRLSFICSNRLVVRFLMAMTFAILSSYGISKSWWMVLSAILFMEMMMRSVNKTMALRYKSVQTIGLLFVVFMTGEMNSTALAQDTIYAVMPFTSIEESLNRPKQVIMTSDQLKRTRAFIDSQKGNEPFSDGLFFNAAHSIKEDPEGKIEIQSDYEYQDFTGKKSFLISGPSDECLSVQAFWNGQTIPLRINPSKSLVEYQLSGSPKGTLRLIKTYQPILDGPAVRVALFATFVSNYDVRVGEMQAKSLFFESQGRSKSLKRIESEKYSLLNQFRIQKRTSSKSGLPIFTEQLTRITAVRTPDGVRWYCRIPVQRNDSGDESGQFKIEMPMTHFLLGTSKCRANPSDQSDSNHSAWLITPDRSAEFVELELLQMTNTTDKYSLQGVSIHGSEYGNKAIIRWVKSDIMAGDWETVPSTIENQDVDDKRWGILVPEQFKSQQTSIADRWEEAVFQFRPEVAHIDRVVQARLFLQKSTVSGQFIIDQSSETELLEIKPIVIDLGVQTKIVSVKASGLLDWGVVQGTTGQIYVQFDVRKRKALRIELDTITTFETVDSISGTGLTTPMELPWPVIDGQIKPPGRLIVEQEVEKESTIWPTPLKHASSVLKNLGEIRDPDTPANMKRWLYQFEGDQPLPHVQWNVSETFSRVQINHELEIHSNKIQWKCEVEYDPISGPLSSIYLRTNPSSVDYKLDMDTSSEFDTKIQHTGNQSQIIIARKRAAFGLVRVTLSYEFPMDPESPFVLPDIVPLGRGRVEKSVSLSGFKREFRRIEKVVENGLTSIRNSESEKTGFWECRKWEFKSTDGSLSISFKKNATHKDQQSGAGIVLEDLLIDRSGEADCYATMRMKIHHDGPNDFKWHDSFGQLIYASVGGKNIDCQAVMSRKVVAVESNQDGLDLLLIVQVKRGQLSEFLKSIRENFLVDGSHQMFMAVRNVEFPREEGETNQISLSEWLSGNHHGMVQSPDQNQVDVDSDWRKISQEQRTRRIVKYSKAIPDDVSLLKGSMQLVSGTRHAENKGSSAQEYVDSLVLSHIGSWRFYRYVGTDQDEAVVPSLYLSTIRGWLLWSELKRRISVSIIFAVAFLAYYQIRKSSVPVLETERKSM